MMAFAHLLEGEFPPAVRPCSKSVTVLRRRVFKAGMDAAAAVVVLS